MSKTRNTVRENRERIKKLTFLALMSALVIVLQFVGNYIMLGGQFPMNLVLVPVVLGAVVCGIGGGAWLGFVAGIMTLLSAGSFYAVNPFATVLICLAKGILAGVAAGAVYGLLSRINKLFAVIVSAVVCPVVNTGIFALGSMAFFLPTLSEWMGSEGYTNVYAYLFLFMIGLNFVVELALNAFFSPVIMTLIDILEKDKSRK